MKFAVRKESRLKAVLVTKRNRLATNSRLKSGTPYALQVLTRTQDLNQTPVELSGYRLLQDFSQRPESHRVGSVL